MNPWRTTRAMTEAYGISRTKSMTGTGWKASPKVIGFTGHRWKASFPGVESQILMRFTPHLLIHFYFQMEQRKSPTMSICCEVSDGKKKPYLLLGGWRQRLGRELDILRFRQSRLKGVSFRKPLASNVGARGELLHIAQRGWIYGGSIVGWVNLHNWRSL